MLQICGSKESYRLTRDVHALKSYMKLIMEACQGAGFDPESHTGAGGATTAAVGGVGGVVPLSMGYKTMLGLIEQLKACADVASTRTSNWQVYCQQEKSKCLRMAFWLDILAKIAV